MLEPIQNQYLQIGYIARSHGINGEVLIFSELNVPILFDEIDLVRIKNARGDLIPARVESYRAQEKNNRLSFFVKFEHVTDRNQAEALKGFAVYAERDRLDLPADEKYGEPDYTSFAVYSEEGKKIGKVQQILDNPAHQILDVTMEDHRQLLIPFVDEYVEYADEEEHIIYCKHLDQLVD